MNAGFRYKAVWHVTAMSLIASAGLHAQTITLGVTGSSNQAQLAWNQLSGPTRYGVMRHELVLNPDGTVRSSTAWAVITTLTGGAYTDVLPSPSVLYEYRIDASARIGTAVSSNTVRYPAPAFRTPTNVTVTGTSTQANVSWSPAADVAGYLVWRRVSNLDGTYSNLTRLTAGPVAVTGFTDAILAGTVYEYQVQSVDAAGLTYPSPWVRYGAPAQLVLAAPTVTITGAADKATVSWSQVYGAASYRIARTQVDPATMQAIGMSAQFTSAGTQMNDVLPQPGAAYEYKVSGIAADGTVGTAARVVYYTPAFTTPTVMSVAGAGGRVAIAWCPPTGVSGYEVWRRTLRTDGTTANLLQLTSAAPPMSNYIDTLPTQSTIYQFQVVGIGSDGRRWPSAWVNYDAGTW